MVNIAIIGDIHLHFSATDVAYFNASPYDLILIVGDLSNYRPRHGYKLARLISQLQKPTLFIPGNHDTVNLPQLLAEVKRNSFFAAVFGYGQARRTRTLQNRLNGIQVGGYTTHPFHIAGQRFDVIAARPFSMGGAALSFKPYLRQQFGVDSMEASARLLKKRVDESDADRLIFLAHNGAFGLGATRSDIWGCDFKKEEGDYGDVDLTVAIEYARAQGKEVLAVAAGHMHHQLKGGGSRQWCVQKDGVCYVNSARVPRIFMQAGEQKHHHVCLSFDAVSVTVEAIIMSH